MPEVQIERKQGGLPWWAWVLALVLVALVIWWIAAAMAGRPGAGPIETAVTQPLVNAGGEAVVPTTEPNTPDIEAANANLPLAAIRANPNNYYNQWVSGMATVSEVLGNRAFRIEQNGTQMLVVKAENIVESTNIVEGNKVSFSGMVVNPADAQGRVPSMDQLDAGTRRTLQNEKAFIHATNIEMQKR